MQYPYKDKSPKIDESAYIAPTAVLIGAVTLGKNSSVWFNAVLRGDLNSIVVGSDSNIQDGCLLHVTHELPVIIEDRVTIGHGAVVHGCHIESDCLIAMGAVILDGAHIGQGSLIAAGAVVSPNTKIPPKSLVMGVPAKVVRQMSEEDLNRTKFNWQHYVEYGRIYKQLPLS